MDRLPTPQQKPKEQTRLKGGFFSSQKKPAGAPEEPQKKEQKAAQAAKREEAASLAQDTAAPNGLRPGSAEDDDPEGQTAAAWKERGNAAFKAKDHEAAIRFYSKGIRAGGGEADKENCALYSNRALCLTQLGRFEEAARDAEVCVRLKPEFPKGYCRGGMALKGLGKPIEAFAFIDRAPPGVVMSNPELAQLQRELKALAAEEEERRLSQMGGAERAKAQGNALFKKAQFEEAVRVYTEGIEACTPAERHEELGLALLNNRAACQHQLSNYRDVVRDTDEVLNVQPENLKARLRRMLALEPLEKYQQALADARFILARDPQNELANKTQHRLSKVARDLEREARGQ